MTNVVLVIYFPPDSPISISVALIDEEECSDCNEISFPGKHAITYFQHILTFTNIFRYKV